MDQLGSHGLFDLTVEAEGDLWIDDHHTTEDIALALGQALAQALGDRKGIHRFGEFSAPLDEVRPRFPGNRPPGRVPSHGSRLLPNSATDPRAPRTQALTHVVLDLSGRPSFNSNLAIPAERIGTFQTEMVEHFRSGGLRADQHHLEQLWLNWPGYSPFAHQEGVKQRKK